jgi:hypothetical protein
MSHQCLMRMLIVFVASCAFIAPVQAEDQKPKRENAKPEAFRFQIGGDKAEGGGVVFRLGEAANYWLGVALEAEDGHLEVEQVLPDSPAAKAGLKPEDVLLSSGKTALKEIADLAKLVQASAGKPLKLRVRREGKEITVEVKPEKQQGRQAIVIGEGGEAEKGGKEQIRLRLEQLIKQARKQAESTRQPAAGPWRALIAPRFARSPAFPDNLEVTIKKKGNNPARIKVRQGAQMWSVKENELDQLPASIRGHVARMLPGRTPAVRLMPGAARPGAPLNPAKPPQGGAAIGAPAKPQAGAAPAHFIFRETGGELQKEIEQLKRQLHELREQVESLRRK